MKPWLIILPLVLLVSVTACSAPNQSETVAAVSAMRTVTDDLGRSVSVPVKIDRAVSLAPSLTEMIFAVGAADRLVGVTTFCNYPEEAKAIRKVGDTMTPNLESIIALKPQIVFVSTASQLEAFMSTLAQQGIAVFVSDAKDLNGVYRNLEQLGDLFETRSRTAEVVEKLKQRVDLVRHGVSYSTRAGSTTRVFVQISNDPLFTIGKDSYLTGIVRDAGGDSVTKDVPTAYPKLSKETALALDPEVIILSDSDDNKEPNAVFKNSRAVKSGRVYKINADIISRPGPRLIDAIEQIAEKLNANSKKEAPE